MKFERSSFLEYYHIPHIGKTKDTCERGLFLYKESEILDFPCPFPVSNIKNFPHPFLIFKSERKTKSGEICSGATGYPQ